MSTIGFIGLGHMGNPMVSNLLAANYKVFVYDVMTAAVAAMEAKGAIAAKSIAALAEQSDVIISSVQTSQQVTDICLQDGIFTHAKKDALYIDCSSIDVTTSKALHQEALIHHIAMVDAPVSGGVAAATAGTLTIMVGGSQENFKRAEEILNKLGKKVIYAGAGGNGQAAKICNNLILGISMIAVSEGFSLAEKLGLDAKTFFEISSHASGQCWSMTSYCPVPGIIENVPSNNDYQPGFMSKMMLKDLRLAHHAAESVNALTPLGSMAAELYELFVNQGGGEKDFSAIIKLL